MKKNILIALLGLTMVFGTAMLIGCDDDGGAPSCSSLCSKSKNAPMPIAMSMNKSMGALSNATI